MKRIQHDYSIIPLIQRKPYQRLDVYPFLILYSCLIICDVVCNTMDEEQSHQEQDQSQQLSLTLIRTIMELIRVNNVSSWLFPCGLVIQIILFIMRIRNIGMEVRIGYYNTCDCDTLIRFNNNTNKKKDTDINEISSWTHCYIRPPIIGGGGCCKASSSAATKTAIYDNASAEIVPIERPTTPVSPTLSLSEATKTINTKTITLVVSAHGGTMLFRYVPIFNGDTGNLAVKDNNVSSSNLGVGNDHEMDSIWYDNNNLSTSTGNSNDNGIDNDDQIKSEIGTLFHRLQYPVDLPPSFYSLTPYTSTHHQQWKGHETTHSLNLTQSIYHTNQIIVNLPPFLTLLSQQLCSPFFLFQLFCVVLWCLDEYWYYSIYTLISLILFECTLCYQRLMGLRRLRETLRVPFEVWVFRGGSSSNNGEEGDSRPRWQIVMSDDIVTGDLISLTSRPTTTNDTTNEEERHVPADLLLLSGSAVVNEAALTGESIPRSKGTIDSIVEGRDGNIKEEELLDIENTEHRRCILFGGTVLIDHRQSTCGRNNGNNAMPNPPDGGCISFVLRTGFDTTRGSLLRGMIRSSTSTNQNNNDTNSSAGGTSNDILLFISLLLFVALLASFRILHHGWYDLNRNRFRLILHVVIVLTSVVPPELPMELSLAVTTSLADLVKRCNVFCTETFRIPLAGCVDTCCFDKTGTLTSDEMILEGVVVVVKQQVDGVVVTKKEEEEVVEGEGRLGMEWEEEKSRKVEVTEQRMIQQIVKPISVPNDVLRVLICCHSLARNRNASTFHKKKIRSSGRRNGSREGGSAAGYGEIIGDPLERAVLEGCQWSLAKDDDDVMLPPTLLPSSMCATGMDDNTNDLNGPNNLNSMRIQHRFAFASGLRRMTVLASDIPFSNASSSPTLSPSLWALTKGAPETIKPLLDPSSIPSWYESECTTQMAKGRRVLVLAYRRLDNSEGAVGTTKATSLSGGVGGKNRTIQASIHGATGGGGGMNDNLFRIGGGRKPFYNSSNVETQMRELVSQWKARGRAICESNLTFAGFALLDCPLKADSEDVIRNLNNTGHRTVMITGDAVLTAAEVARKVGIIDDGGGTGTTSASSGNNAGVTLIKKKEIKKKVKTKRNGEDGKVKAGVVDIINIEMVVKDVITYEIRECEVTDEDTVTGFEFVPVHSSSGNGLITAVPMTYTTSNIMTMSNMVKERVAAICVTGDVLVSIATTVVSVATVPDRKMALLHPDASSALSLIVPLISVFARHSPNQKEAVIAILNGCGRTTLMIGDGTNDVGALRTAHVGISIVSVPGVEARQREAADKVESVRKEEKRERKRRKKEAAMSSGEGRRLIENKKAKLLVEASKKRKMKVRESLRLMAEAEEELAGVSLGDASVASPFTSRTTSVKCVSDILQRGRCTLVTMLQIYKILGVNCLVNALVLSTLHIEGARQGDRQLTAHGIVVAALFLFVTRGKPIDELSPQRPPSTVLCGRALSSIVFQFLVHLVCIQMAMILSKLYLDPYDPSYLVPDGPFVPNVLNTSTFLIYALASVNTFATYHPGRPYVQDLSENAALRWTLCACYIVLFVCVSEIFPPLNDLLQLSPLPSEEVGEWFKMTESKSSLLPRSSLPSLPPLTEVFLYLVNWLGYKVTLCSVMVVDIIACQLAEKVVVGCYDWLENPFRYKFFASKAIKKVS